MNSELFVDIFPTTFKVSVLEDHPENVPVFVVDTAETISVITNDGRNIVVIFSFIEIVLYSYVLHL